MLVKMLRNILKFLTSRIFVVFFIIASQFMIIMTFILKYGIFNDGIRLILYIINLTLTIKVVNRYSNPAYKLAWIIIILGLPFVGGVTYLLFAERKVPKSLRGKIIRHLNESKELFEESPNIEIEDQDIAQILDYTNRNGYYPYCQNTSVKYYPIGEEYFKDLIAKIQEAKHFIFIEFFIIKDGYMLDTLLEALKERIEQGVEVYLLYDDGGCITCLPNNFKENLTQIGIKVVTFSPITLKLSLLSRANNRSHRKIVVIDNLYAFTGGFNIADEYINKISRFGHWKDTGAMFKGEAVWNFTVMFIQFYNASVEEKDTLRYLDFKDTHEIIKNNSIVLPFSDSPTDDEDLCRATHFNIITHAKKYVYIHTPYLIIDYDLTNALRTAAKSGVEVIITVPHIPDKVTVFAVTQSNYQALIEAGVKIYEYTPGFIHSKLVVSDDKIAIVGTFNMDFRSYYLNYECGAIIANDKEILKMKEDYLDTLKKSEEITVEKVKSTNFIVRVLRAILNVFAPLL